ncbi:hypothetical protein EON64_01195, partial [archaeon]
MIPVCRREAGESAQQPEDRERRDRRERKARKRQQEVEVSKLILEKVQQQHRCDQRSVLVSCTTPRLGRVMVQVSLT